MIDIIDPTMAAQNDGGAMAVVNELALFMTGGGEATLDSALRGLAADRGDGEAPLGQLLKDALQGGGSHRAMAALELLIDRFGIDPADAATAAPARGRTGEGGGGHPVDSGGGEADLATMSLMYSDGGEDPGEGNYVDENGNGKWDPGETILVTGEKPKTMDEDDDIGGLPTSGGDGGDDSGGDGPGGGELIGDEQDKDPDCSKTNKVMGVTPPDNAKYYVPESVTADFLIDAIRHIISISDNSWSNRFAVMAEIKAMYTDPNHPFFVDFKDWGTDAGPPGSVGGGTMTYFSPAAGTMITASVFEPFGNYFFGLITTFGGLSPEEIRAAAAWFSESGSWWEGDDLQDAPHVTLGIADANKYIINDQESIFGIEQASCPK